MHTCPGHTAKSNETRVLALSQRPATRDLATRPPATPLQSPPFRHYQRRPAPVLRRCSRARSEASAKTPEIALEVPSRHAPTVCGTRNADANRFELFSSGDRRSCGVVARPAKNVAGRLLLVLRRAEAQHDSAGGWPPGVRCCLESPLRVVRVVLCRPQNSLRD